MMSPNRFSSKITLSIKTSGSAVKRFKGNISKVQTTLIFLSNIFFFGGGGGGCSIATSVWRSV